MWIYNSITKLTYSFILHIESKFVNKIFLAAMTKLILSFNTWCFKLSYHRQVTENLSYVKYHSCSLYNLYWCLGIGKFMNCRFSWQMSTNLVTGNVPLETNVVKELLSMSISKRMLLVFVSFHILTCSAICIKPAVLSQNIHSLIVILQYPSLIYFPNQIIATSLSQYCQHHT